MHETEMDRNTLFYQNLPPGFAAGEDLAHRRLFREYGAVFVARGGVLPPEKVVFENEVDVAEFQSRMNIRRAEIGGLQLELQSAAMEGLLRAIDEAKRRGVTLGPRGPDSARRNYNDTVELWKSRVEPALNHWSGCGRIMEATADLIRSLSPYEQVAKVFELEEKAIYFSKDLSKSIIYSVAPPGASQHLSLLAFDVADYEDPVVRRILAKHFWYQTVVSDLPHFTYLGVEASKLDRLGLRVVENEGGREFRVPNI